MEVLFHKIQLMFHNFCIVPWVRCQNSLSQNEYNVFDAISCKTLSGSFQRHSSLKFLLNTAFHTNPIVNDS